MEKGRGRGRWKKKLWLVATQRDSRKKVSQLFVIQERSNHWNGGVDRVGPARCALHPSECPAVLWTGTQATFSLHFFVYLSVSTLSTANDRECPGFRGAALHGGEKTVSFSWNPMENAPTPLLLDIFNETLFGAVRQGCNGWLVASCILQFQGVLPGVYVNGCSADWLILQLLVLQ